MLLPADRGVDRTQEYTKPMRRRTTSISNLAAFKLSLIAGVWIAAQSALASDFPGYWDADVTPVLCLMGSRSGWVYDGESQLTEPGPVTARVLIGRFHEGAENTLAHVAGLDIEPLFVHLQVFPSVRLRMDDVAVTKVVWNFDGDDVAPIVDSEEENDQFPVYLLGGEEASRFVSALENGQAPVVSVRLSDAQEIEVPITTTGFHVARSMMQTCITESGNLAED